MNKKNKRVLAMKKGYLRSASYFKTNGSTKFWYHRLNTQN
jgi:hypothetical protein